MGLGKEPSIIPPENLALYEALVKTNPDIQRKGDKVPYTSLNGHMFSYLDGVGSLILRLPSAEREAFLKKYETPVVMAYGTVMKEYVEVPFALLKNTKALKKYFDISVEYIASLKPKPTTKKKAVATKKPVAPKKAAPKKK